MADYEVMEWWDHDGVHHPGQPDSDQLLDDATQVTIHAWNEAGDEIFFTSFSYDGWEYDELDVDVDDALEGYGIST